jgi:hypothetical protein
MPRAQDGRALGPKLLKCSGSLQPSTLRQHKLRQVQNPGREQDRESIFRTPKESYDFMQGQWHIRRQVERQRSQHYLMPRLPRASTGKTIRGTIQDR